ncbi:ExeM/NucH family extracellular endonuclease [Azoarcus olearius]|uniref:Extracellular nuclease n=1 Tax=Azoarcus sp. (strain BH72) TaxID=418699 RepID=A1K5J6_AZOSB|nr:ExeM/NucH family extracellular endonuclease [Azoarcus olearius]CAL94101.1 putative extracellular nuclease [Azoarcus olearius]
MPLLPRPIALAVLIAGLGAASLATAAPTELFFSEYIEGSANNKALEIHNGTGAPIDLAAGGYVVQMYFNGSTTAGLSIPLTGVIAAGDVFVLAQAAADSAVLAVADQINASAWYNGDDAVVLRKGGTTGALIDVIGQIGMDPGTEWGSGLASTADNTLRRKAGVARGDTVADDAFDPAVEWDGYATNSFDGLGSHLASGSDGGGDGGTGGGSDSAQCGGAQTPIGQIQGRGSNAAITGAVVTRGVVVGDYELPGGSGQMRGFYIQDPVGDGDPETSDGLFVYNAGRDHVALGDLVLVSGTASEYQGQTQLSATAITRCGTGTVAPTDIYLPLADANALERYEGMLVRLPQTLYVTEHYQLGRFGQMVVSSGERLPQPTAVAAPGAAALGVQAQNDLNRIIIDDADNDQNPDPIRFARDDAPLSAANTLRGGDSASDIVGVLTWGWAGNSASGNAWRVRPANALGGNARFSAANPRPIAAPAVAGTLKVASINLLNYFNTFDGRPDTVDNCRYGLGGAPTDCRGADDGAEFERQAAKTVAAILALDADVIGLMEVENDGYGADSALADLVGRLNAVAGPGAYAYLDADAAAGKANALGTDAIKTGLIYRPAKVTRLGTAVLDRGAFGLYTTVSEGTLGRNRPALAQSFRAADGARFTVAVNHLKSKSSSCAGNIAPVPSDPDLGDGQGDCNRTRSTAARELAAWLATDPTAAGDGDVLIIGDLNAYAQEDPVTALTDAGYTDLVGRDVGRGAYSYVFDGQWGYLDHALASPSLARQVSGVAEWHINADEPSVLDYNTDYKSAAQIAGYYAADLYRASDHDPVVIGLDLDGQPPLLQLSATPPVLWPANHGYVDVKVSATVSDNRDPAPQVKLLSVRSSEPDQGTGDGDTANDIVVLDPYRFRLRAERAGHGSGRIYTLTYEARDYAGNTRTATTTVTVPHSAAQ